MYFKHQPWLAVPRGDDLVKTLAQKFNVRGVPRLIMLNAHTGETIDADCLKAVKETGPVSIEKMLSKI